MCPYCGTECGCTCKGALYSQGKLDAYRNSRPKKEYLKFDAYRHGWESIKGLKCPKCKKFWGLCTC